MFALVPRHSHVLYTITHTRSHGSRTLHTTHLSTNHKKRNTLFTCPPTTKKASVQKRQPPTASTHTSSQAPYYMAKIESKNPGISTVVGSASSLASLTGRAAHARLALLHSPESRPRELSRAFWTTLWRRNGGGWLVINDENGSGKNSRQQP